MAVKMQKMSRMRLEEEMKLVLWLRSSAVLLKMMIKSVSQTSPVVNLVTIRKQHIILELLKCWKEAGFCKYFIKDIDDSKSGLTKRCIKKQHIILRQKSCVHSMD